MKYLVRNQDGSFEKKFASKADALRFAAARCKFRREVFKVFDPQGRFIKSFDWR